MGFWGNWRWRGFTIVEMIVASSILVLVGVGIATSMDLAMRMSQNSNLSLSATAVAESLMEQLRADFTEEDWQSKINFALSYNNVLLDLPASNEWTDFNLVLPDGHSMDIRFCLSASKLQWPDAFSNDQEDVVLMSLDYQWKNAKGVWVRAASPLVAIRYPYS